MMETEQPPCFNAQGGTTTAMLPPWSTVFARSWKVTIASNIKVRDSRCSYDVGNEFPNDRISGHPHRSIGSVVSRTLLTEGASVASTQLDDSQNSCSRERFMGLAWQTQSERHTRAVNVQFPAGTERTARDFRKNSEPRNLGARAQSESHRAGSSSDDQCGSAHPTRAKVRS